jgi:hypothetical protein
MIAHKQITAASLKIQNKTTGDLSSQETVNSKFMEPCTANQASE